MEYMNVSPKSTTFKHKDVWRILEVFLVGFSLIRVLCLAYFDSGKMSRISCFYELRTNQWSVFSHYVCTCSVTQSCPTLCNPWTVTHQSPLSMEFSRQEYCNNGVGCHFFLHGIFPNPGIKLVSPVSPALAGGVFTTEPCGKPLLFLQVWPIPNIKAEISTRPRLTWTELQVKVVEFTGWGKKSFQSWAFSMWIHFNTPWSWEISALEILKFWSSQIL